MQDGSTTKHDLFVSYASADNWNPLDVPWVTQFHADLTGVLERQLGRFPAISFIDSNARRHLAADSFARPDAIRDCAAFLAILSPSYVTTERTIAELDAFRSAAAAGSRIVAVELLPVGSLDRFPQLEGVRRTRFWKDRGGSSVELTPQADAIDYAERLEDLGRQIVGLLTGRAPIPPSEQRPPAPAPMMLVVPVEPPARPPAPVEAYALDEAPASRTAPQPSYERSTPEYWLRRVARERNLPPASDPLVVISYAGEDQRWINELRAFLDLSLNELRDPDGRTYQLWSFADARRGTVPGDEFPEIVAEKMWCCRAAILVLSTDYFSSQYCREIELPFLLWRREHHKLLCVPVRLGTLPLDRAPLPKYEHPSRYVVFNDMIDDRQAATGFASSPHRDLTLLQLVEREIKSERDDRYQGVARHIGDFLKKRYAAVQKG